MGHVISYTVQPKDVDRMALAAEIREMALENGDGWEEAERAINGFDRGWYDDHAVLFRNLECMEDSKRTADARASLRKAEEELATARLEGKASRRACESVTCPVCGSRIMVHKMWRDVSMCPVCNKGDLRTKAAIGKVARLEQAVEKKREQLHKAQLSQKDRAPICWLVKYEYHC